MARTPTACPLATAIVMTMTLVACTPEAFSQTREPQIYSLRMMGALRISVPVTAPSADVRYRNAEKRWVPVSGSSSEGVITVDLSPVDVPDGHTLLLVGVPSGVNIDDHTPPRVTGLSVDNVSHAPLTHLQMGGVDALPRRISIEVADDQSPLRRKTLRIAANGRPVRLRGPGVEYRPLGSRRAQIAIDVPALLGEGARQNTITLGIDDYALDEGSLDFVVSFTMEPPHTLPDGTIARVDSVTSSSGWADWWVIFDGYRMDGSGGTTAGKTWLSEGNALPHWLRLDFPQPRTVSEVAIAWAYWESYRTSQHYQLQALVDGEWVTLVDAAPEKPTQESRHTFGPVTASAIRLWQPAMMGNSAEPQYLWLSEFEVR